MEQRVLLVITKSNFGEQANCFACAPVLSFAQEQPLSNSVRLAVGGPTMLRAQVVTCTSL